MDELNRPLGRPDSGKQDSREGAKSALSGTSAGMWIAAAIVIGAVAYAGWGVFLAAGDKTVVAKLEDGTATGPSEPSQSDNSSVNPSTNPEDELPEESRDELAVRPLSPLEPVSPNAPSGSSPTVTTPPTGAQPSFSPQADPAAPQRRSAGFPNPDLVEPSEFGSLPKIGSTGRRALDEYSQSTGTVGANRVAIIVGGLGLSQTGTQEAIEALPSGITLGFSSMGNSLQRWVQKAREEGHEVVLQVPMEPLGYPSINPGPRTLTSSASFGANLGNLRWSLGRMTNYPLVMNYLGAGLVNKRESLEPLLEEIKNRGLGYIDDGSVAASQAVDLAKTNRVPHVQATMTLDVNQSPDRIDAQLNALQSLARQRGFAIGVATAFPVSVERIARWAKNAQGQDVQIVPVSNLIRDYRR